MYRGRRVHQIHFNKPPSSHFSKSTATPGMTTSVQQPPAYSDRQCSQLGTQSPKKYTRLLLLITSKPAVSQILIKGRWFGSTFLLLNSYLYPLWLQVCTLLVSQTTYYLIDEVRSSQNSQKNRACENYFVRLRKYNRGEGTDFLQHRPNCESRVHTLAYV